MQPWILEKVTVTDELLLTSQEQWGSRVPLLQEAIWSPLLQILHRGSSRPLSAWPGRCPFHLPFIRSHSCDKRETVKFSTTNKPTGQSPSSPARFLLPPLVCLPNETSISIYLSFFLFFLRPGQPWCPALFISPPQTGSEWQLLARKCKAFRMLFLGIDVCNEVKIEPVEPTKTH